MALTILTKRSVLDARLGSERSPAGGCNIVLTILTDIFPHSKERWHHFNQLSPFEI